MQSSKKASQRSIHLSATYEKNQAPSSHEHKSKELKLNCITRWITSKFSDVIYITSLTCNCLKVTGCSVGNTELNILTINS